MYNIPYFKENDHKEVVAFMRQHSFAMLVGCYEHMPVATQVPLLIEESGDRLFLYGHIMRNTDHHKALEKNAAALCIFSGPHTYVSARWYTNPQTASTWNYMSVHARGRIEFLEEAHLRTILEKTTALFEADPQSPASFHQLPEEYINRLLKAIIGFRIEVQSLENIFKLSQNRDESSYHHIINQLEQQDDGAKAIAAEMKKRAPQLFKK